MQDVCQKVDVKQHSFLSPLCVYKMSGGYQLNPALCSCAHPLIQHIKSKINREKCCLLNELKLEQNISEAAVQDKVQMQHFYYTIYY